MHEFRRHLYQYHLKRRLQLEVGNIPYDATEDVLSWVVNFLTRSMQTLRVLKCVENQRIQCFFARMCVGTWRRVARPSSLRTHSSLLRRWIDSQVALNHVEVESFRMVFDKDNTGGVRSAIVCIPLFCSPLCALGPEETLQPKGYGFCDFSDWGRALGCFEPSHHMSKLKSIYVDLWAGPDRSPLALVWDFFSLYQDWTIWYVENNAENKAKDDGDQHLKNYNYTFRDWYSWLWFMSGHGTLRLPQTDFLDVFASSLTLFSLSLSLFYRKTLHNIENHHFVHTEHAHAHICISTC